MWHQGSGKNSRMQKTANRELFKPAVDDLYIMFTEFLLVLKMLEYIRQNKDAAMDLSSAENDMEGRFKLIVRATLLNQLLLYHEYTIERIYKIVIIVFCNSDNSLQDISINRRSSALDVSRESTSVS